MMADNFFRETMAVVFLAFTIDASWYSRTYKRDNPVGRNVYSGGFGGVVVSTSNSLLESALWANRPPALWLALGLFINVYVTTFAGPKKYTAYGAVVMVLVDLVTGDLPSWAVFFGEYFSVDDWSWNVKRVELLLDRHSLHDNSSSLSSCPSLSLHAVVHPQRVNFSLFAYNRSFQPLA
jgi:hypothetical protein